MLPHQLRFIRRLAPIAIDPAHFSLVKILRTDQPALKRPQQDETQKQRQRQRDQKMDIERRVIRSLQPEREGHGGNGGDRHGDKKAGPSAGSAKP